jgi:carboxylesterase type B
MNIEKKKLFIRGGPAVPLYNARTLTNRTEVIVVNAAYRLGALGALVYQGGGGGGGGFDVGGNFNLLDQQQVLRWVKAEIGAFGGDAGKVTIVGQSAGAMSVGIHL